MTAAAGATSLVTQDQFWATLQTGDVEAGRALVGQELDAAITGASIVCTLLVPAQREVGLRWQRADWSVADEHAATAVVDASLAMLEQNAALAEPSGRLVVVASPESEWHSLPARFAAYLLREAGWEVRFLGPSLPADHLREYLARLAPQALVLSATMPTSLPGAARCIDAAHDLRVPVVAGGAAFGTDAARAHLLGADAWYSDITQFAVPELRRPRAAGVEAPGWADWAALQASREAICDRALPRMLAVLPGFAAEATPKQLVRAREDLGRIVDFVSVAVLVDDATVFETFRNWLEAVLAARGVTRAAVDVCYAVLANELGGRASSLLGP